MTASTLIAELMAKYDESRAKWVALCGSADGFDAWFTQQVMG
jgi:hypothetical protein